MIGDTVWFYFSSSFQSTHGRWLPFLISQAQSGLTLTQCLRTGILVSSGGRHMTEKNEKKKRGGILQGKQFVPMGKTKWDWSFGETSLVYMHTFANTSMFWPQLSVHKNNNFWEPVPSVVMRVGDDRSTVCFGRWQQPKGGSLTLNQSRRSKINGRRDSYGLSSITFWFIHHKLLLKPHLNSKDLN